MNPIQENQTSGQVSENLLPQPNFLPYNILPDLNIKTLSMMISLMLCAENAMVRSSLFSRSISTTSQNLIKEIQQKREKDSLRIEAVHIPSPRSHKMLKEACQPKFCPECSLGLDIKHTDVLILSQYVRSDGCMLPKRITGLCYRQQKRIGTLVTMAQKAGLMPNLAPANSKKDPQKRFGWKKFNKYFLESTIKY